MMIQKEYEDKSAIYNWTEEDFENLKPKVDTLRSIIKSHGKGNYVEMESSGLKVRYDLEMAMSILISLL